ncbi:MAG: type II toxin-antitoxin system Phd/YefM family antitoxin [Clostridiales bacterium]|jgi:PHD/YefM family antitoxin component YafN of YafNO toxin-antitoxin module|nr:type II toxin-antitoxin system Phd/YefM family antitoxin [Clostridiales bacterium]
MAHVTANVAQRDFTSLLDSVISYGNTVSIATDDGAAILVNKDDWHGMLETLYLKSIPGMEESILEGKATPLSECLDSVGWSIS